MKNKAIFFDRDGIVNKRLVGDYVKNLSEFDIYEDFVNSFEQIKNKGYKAFLITNQQGIGKGLMTEDDLTSLHDHLQQHLLNATGNEFDGIYFCGDLADTGSKMRKPEPGMILKAAEDHNIDLAASWMIGDSLSDIEAGHRAGTNTILVSKTDSYNNVEPPTLHIPVIQKLPEMLRLLPKVN
jgi:D-glycero-D-manno-heptose 1,7-bisphosphate phosphatase